MGAGLIVDSLERDDGEHAWQVRIAGDLDASSADDFDAALEGVVAAGARLVVLDLSEVNFLDSTGLRGILRVSASLDEQGGRLTVAGLSGAAERVLEITGLLERLRDAGPRED